jgi:4'-phosphopantetheinyl transferase
MNEPAKKANSDLEYAAPDVRNGLGTSAEFKWDLQAGAYSMWTTAPPTLKASRNEIHIWRVEANEANAARLSSSMTGAEHAHARCFRLPASRNEFIVARGFMRFVLGRYLGVPAGFVQFRERQYGKPELASQPDGDRLTFNLSHCHGIILAAITVGHEVGIDIEFLNANSSVSEVARIVFSPSEESWLSQLPDDDRQLNYFRGWTRKEAFVKALGEGLSDRIRQVEIVPADGVLLARIAGIPAGDHWIVQDPDVGDSFVAAIAVASRNCRLRLWDWSGTPGNPTEQTSLTCHY